MFKLIKRVRNKLSQLYQKFDFLLVRLCSLTPFLSSVYYTFFNRIFFREHQKLLKSRIAYRKRTMERGTSSYLLRRNIHRLEKGLIMKPKKPVFAEKYIQETVECFVLNNNEQYDINEFKWVADVLTEYFRIVELTPVIQMAKQKFEETMLIENNVSRRINENSAEQWVPYQPEHSTTEKWSFDEFKALCMQRHSTRWFTTKLVDMRLIEKAIEVAAQAPSACNRQPFQFKVFNNNIDASKVASLAMGTKGIHQNFQCIVVVLGDLSAYANERDRHLVYIDASLAAMQFMLALETLGLSTCPINWPDIEKRERALDALLELPDFIRPVMMIAIGYADGVAKVPYSQKKSVHQLSPKV